MVAPVTTTAPYTTHRHVEGLAHRCRRQGFIHNFYSNGTLSRNKWTATLPIEDNGTYPHRFFVSDMDFYRWLKQFPVREDM